MIRYITTLILFIVCFQFSFAQDDIFKNSGYYKSLELHVLWLKEISPDLDTILVENKNYLKDYSGSIIDGVFIETVNMDFIKEKTKRHRTFEIVIIAPLVF